MDTDLQKAGIWKRISAFLFDAIILSVVVAGFAFLISFITGYDAYNEKLSDKYIQYSQEYGVDFELSEEQYAALTAGERARYEDAYAAMNADAELVRCYDTVVNLTLLTVSLSFLFAYVVLELAVPFFLGNGQTAGKKIFGICLMRTDGIKLRPVQLVVRTLLGKYTVETMVPALLIIMIYFGSLGLEGTMALIILAILQLVLFGATRTNSPIHDLLAGTVAVDMASQRIFESEAELNEHINSVCAARGDGSGKQ